MRVLIATGVLATYLASIPLLVVGGDEIFFEVIALLVTFGLFGQRMEMQSRKRTGESLRTLFDLVPPAATMLGDGREVEIPTAQIGGDTAILRPGEKVATDGEALNSGTSIDAVPVSSESRPVENGPGDPVVGTGIGARHSIPI